MYIDIIDIIFSYSLCTIYCLAACYQFTILCMISSWCHLTIQFQNIYHAGDLSSCVIPPHFYIFEGLSWFSTLNFASLSDSLYFTVSSFQTQRFRNFRNGTKFFLCLPFCSSNAVLNVALPHFLIGCQCTWYHL